MGFTEVGGTFTQTLNLSCGTYVFEIVDGAADGICCDFGLGSYTLFVDDVPVAQGGAFGANATEAFQICDIENSVIVSVQYDQFPSETSWSLSTDDGTVLFTAPPATTSELFQQTFNMRHVCFRHC